MTMTMTMTPTPSVVHEAVRPPHATKKKKENTSTFDYDTDVVMNDGTTVIKTTVTNSGDAVKRFLQDIRKQQQQQQATTGGTRKPLPLTVGLDTEWRAVFDRDSGRRCGSRLAVLQLCVGRRCLVFQIVNADYVPAALRAFFLGSSSGSREQQHRFVGVAVAGDVERLYCDRGIRVGGAVDLGHLAAEALGRPELRNAGLKTLAREVMGVLVDKPKHVTMSKWARGRLSPEQVRYAAIDAFVSYEVGRLLLASQRAQDAATISPFGYFELP